MRLRNRGFESVVVRSVTWTAEHSLASFHRRPSRANAAAFVDELIAACVVPRLQPRDVAALGDGDRARLRRAVVNACGRGAEWRRLHGSHLVPDERLFAVMLWRWQERESLFEELRVRRPELAKVETSVAVAAQSIEAKFGVGVGPQALASTLASLHSGPAFEALRAFREQPVFEAARVLERQAVFEAARLIGQQPLFEALSPWVGPGAGVAQFLRDAGTLVADSVAVTSSSAFWFANPAKVRAVDVVGLASVAQAAARAQDFLARSTRT